MNFYERLNQLIKESGKSMNQVERELNFPRNTIQSYKRSNPSSKRLTEIAKYFDVSIDYLLGNSELKSSSSSIKSPKLEELITQIDHLDEDIKEEIIIKMKQLLEEETKNK